MKTQLDQALSGQVTPEMRAAAGVENVTPEKVLEEIAIGHAVLCANPSHKDLTPAVVGRHFRTKVNANLGLAADTSDGAGELSKLRTALSAGADFVMDLSVGDGLAELRKGMIAASPVAVGTVPMYEAVCRVGGKGIELTTKCFLDVITEQAEQGVDFMTLHAGLLREHVPLAMKRLLGIASRGGSIMAEWMAHHEKENPLYEQWNDVLDICHAHDVTVSLGDGLRPGCLADASDAAQFAELDVLGELVLKCRERGVQVMVEGPGHVPFDQIQMNVERAQKVCDGAPFYVLGPVVTDIAPGYDHITSCIGATAAGYYGASLLCYVTPSEHLGLPTDDEVRQGVIAYRIAAHAADVARGLAGARDVDDKMAAARMGFDWEKQFELAIDGEHAKQRHALTKSSDDSAEDFCSMCGKDFCAVRTSKRIHEATH